MLKKLSIYFLCAVSIFAVEVVIMPDGRSVILNKDGSWEEVTLAKMGDKTVALKKDGTWVVVDKEVAALKPKVKEEVSEVKKAKASASKKDDLKGFAKNILGTWRSSDGKREYVFTKDHRMKLIKDSDVVEDYFTLVSADKDKRIIRIGIGKRFKMGPFSMGGKIIKFKLSPDLNTLYDLSEVEETYQDVKLKRVK